MAEALIGYLPHNQALLLATRLRIELNAESASVQEQMMKQASRWDEATLCRFLLEASLLPSAYHRPQNSKDDALLATATRYRVDVAKLQKKITAELVAKQEKKRKREEKPKAGTTA